jgi:phosphoserine phosphatase
LQTGDPTGLDTAALLQVLEMSRKLAAPFDLGALLIEIVAAARDVLRAERATVWLYEPAMQRLVLASDGEGTGASVTLGQGLLGKSARSRTVINVPDCRLDPDFDPAADLDCDQDVRSLLSVPLVNDGALIGVLQVVDKEGGTFAVGDEAIAQILAAQCVVAIDRERNTARLLAAQKLEREIGLAREIQMSTLPAQMPDVPGYDLAGRFVPADQTGGDTFDLVPIAPDRVFVLLGDASGHGIGPALSATQMTAMLRVALRLGAGLDDLFTHVNDQLVEDLPEEHFVTAFLGVLDASTHRIRFHSGGQGPLLHFEAAGTRCHWLAPTTFPMGFMGYGSPGAAAELGLAPGDLLALVSDGVFEIENPAGQRFGTGGVAAVIARVHDRPMAKAADEILAAALAFAGSAPQLDDMTVLLVRRLAEQE